MEVRQLVVGVVVEQVVDVSDWDVGAGEADGVGVRVRLGVQVLCEGQ